MIINLLQANHFLSKKIYDQFNKALKERSDRGHYAEITFIGINSADIKEHKKINKALQVTVDFVAEIITCIKIKIKKLFQEILKKLKKYMILGLFQET